MSDPERDYQIQEADDDEEFVIDPSEVIQVIELDENTNAGQQGSDEGEENDEDMDDDDEGAGAGPSQDDSKLSFNGHRESEVICCAVSPTDPCIVVTGGQDDQALVWNAKDGSVYFQCTGHTDTVVGVGFSHDGSLVATADMKGLVQVWTVDSGNKVWDFEVSEIEWLQWHHAAAVLLVATKEGQVWMWKIPAGDLKTFTGTGPSALCGKILPDGKRACIGYEDGVVKIWDLKSAEVLFSVSGMTGHKESVFSLAHNMDGSLVMTGSGDCTAKLINTLTGKVVATLSCHCSSSEEDDSVECVEFCRSHGFAATGTLGGALEVWDLATQTVRHRCQHPAGIVKLKWSANSSIVYTACLDGNIRAYEGRSGELIKTWQGHAAAILDFDLSRDETFLLSASDDCTAKVFELKS